jgi:asparagine synthase (glutamine-hydrolysing)
LRTPYLDNELVALAYRIPEHLRKSPQAASRLISANSKALSKIPTDRGFGGDNSGLPFLFRRFIAEATFKADYYNSEGLPHGLSRFDSLFRRVSSIFGILGLHKYLPYRHWLRRELAPHVRDVLADTRAQQMGFWNVDFLKRLAADHVSGRKNYVREINAVLTLEAVERLLFRELPIPPSRNHSVKLSGEAAAAVR